MRDSDLIISASYKTDIPTFYGEWFMNRLRAGECKMVNPYGRQEYTINLRREEHDGREGVDGIVFWTKNIGPLVKHLPEIAERGYPFVVQHTINGYPRELEARVIDYARTVECVRQVADEFGQLKPSAPGEPYVPRVIWRYDPIVFTSLTPPDWHKRNFARLAKALEGVTNEVVISFAQIYKKTRRNMDAAAVASGFTWNMHERLAYPKDDSSSTYLALLLFMAGIAATHGMKLKVCAQERFLVPGIIEEAHCIDAAWFGQTYKKHGNRDECACSASRDIGAYDTCPHGCVYCYAVQNRELALARHKRHDPNGDFLFEPEFPTIQVERRPKPAAKEKAPKKRTRNGKKKPVAASAAILSQPALFT
ncbi:MAG TPA: DUF1848 domain-containing protein [Ktedonobacterales bacterium]|nr:DUF1848 domain-containing protein [Ktedonobacterales bacterium]